MTSAEQPKRLPTINPQQKQIHKGPDSSFYMKNGELDPTCSGLLLQTRLVFFKMQLNIRDPTKQAHIYFCISRPIVFHQTILQNKYQIVLSRNNNVMFDTCNINHSNSCVQGTVFVRNIVHFVLRLSERYKAVNSSG